MDVELSARIARLEARFAILEAIAQLTACWDAKDAEGYAAAFTDDAVFEAYAPGATTPLPQLVGRAAIADWAQRQFQGPLAQATQRHVHSDPVFVHLAEGEATVWLTELVLRRDAAGTAPQVTAMLVAEMMWQRTGDGWRAARGTLRLE